MRQKVAIILFIPALFILFAAAFVLAQQTGSISGKITDSQTRQPLVGATVILVGTNRGANTDLDGKYIINNVPPGTYSLRVTQIGYQQVEIKNVVVKTDLTVEVNSSMTPAHQGLDDKITVEAEVDIIDKFEVSGKSTITKETIDRAPVQSVDELMEKVAGAVKDKDGKVYIRGGRAFEVQYQTDGVPKEQSETRRVYNSPGIVTDCLVQTPRQTAGQRVVIQSEDDYPSCIYPVDPRGRSFHDMYFQDYGTNPFVLTARDYQSTFAIDIDDASYTLTRSYLEISALPPNEAVRVEEFINHFNYNYELPKQDAFAVSMEGAPSRFGHNSKILQIGIQGKKLNYENRKPANIVFVVDVSGSMARGNRINLVRQTLRHIIDRMSARDRVGIVCYNQNASVVLNSTSIRNKKKIITAIEQLQPHGSTNVQSGLHLGYQMANRGFDPEFNNCLLLFSDGVANTGQTNAEKLLNETSGYAKKGITLSSFGVGMGNYNDVLLEKLSNKGNGFYAYIDDIEQARRVFNGNITVAIQAIARDVKIQVEFDPDVVYSYRLLGYENRNVADYDFRNDNVDGGEVSPGHSVTALYEIYLKGPNQDPYWKRNQNADLGRVFVRYKNPESGYVEEVTVPIEANIFKRGFSYSTSDLKLASCAAEFAEIMRNSYWSRYSDLNSVLKLAKEVYHETEDSDVLELVQLITRARDLRSMESDYFSRE